MRKGAVAKLVDFGPGVSAHVAHEERLGLGKQKTQRISAELAHSKRLLARLYRSR